MTAKAPSKRHTEIANASIVMQSELPARFVASKHTDVLVQTAKRIERLQARGRKLRREIRNVEQEIRAERKNLKALANAIGRGE